MPTIMQVLPSLISGGVERGTIEIAKSLVKNGYESIVVSSGGGLLPELERVRTEHISLDVQTKNPIKILLNIGKIERLLRECKVNILHTRSRAPAWSCYYAAQKVPGVRFVTTVHGIYNYNNCLKKAYNNIMTKGDKVIAVSNFVKEDLLRRYKADESKIVVVPRGVDSSYYDVSRLEPYRQTKFRLKYNIPAGVPVLLLPGRFTSWKGQLLLVEAIKKIKHLDFYCLLVGDLAKRPAYVDQVKHLIADSRLQHKMQIFGSENDMFNLYGVSDIVLSTSIEPEAFGRTVIEGQAMQRLVIASNIGGASETICHEKNGLHFEAANVNDLAEKISYALKIINTQTWTDLCNNARESVSVNYSLENMQKRTLEVYKDLL